MPILSSWNIMNWLNRRVPMLYPPVDLKVYRLRWVYSMRSWIIQVLLEWNSIQFLFLKFLVLGTLNSVELYWETKLNYVDKSSKAILNSGTWDSIVYYMQHAREIATLQKQLNCERIRPTNPKLVMKWVWKRFLRKTFLLKTCEILQIPNPSDWWCEELLCGHANSCLLYGPEIPTFAQLVWRQASHTVWHIHWI